MMLQISTGQEHVVSTLIAAGADLSLKTKDGGTCLHAAVHAGNYRMVQNIIASLQISLDAPAGDGDRYGCHPAFCLSSLQVKLHCTMLLRVAEAT